MINTSEVVLHNIIYCIGKHAHGELHSMLNVLHVSRTNFYVFADAAKARMQVCQLLTYTLITAYSIYYISAPEGLENISRRMTERLINLNVSEPQN